MITTLRRTLKRSALISAITLTGVTAALHAVPAAHAAPTASISVTGQGGGAQVYGFYFTAGVSLRVEILDSSLSHVVSTQYLTAWENSTHAYGVFDVLMSTSYTGSAWVAVDQAGHATAWAKVNVTTC